MKEKEIIEKLKNRITKQKVSKIPQKINISLEADEILQIVKVLEQTEEDRWTCPICKGFLTCISCSNTR